MDKTPLTPSADAGERQSTNALADVSDALLDAAVEHLRQLAHVALVEFAVAAGRYVVDTFFDGNIGKFFDRSSSKATSFNALCTRRAEELEAIGLSQSTLRRYVHAYDTWRHLPDEARTNLSLHTLELLRKVPDQVSRTELLLSAKREGWSPGTLAQQMAAKAVELAPPPSKLGRPRLPAGEKALRGLVRQAQAVAKNRAAIASLPAQKLATLRAELRAALAEVEGVLGEG